MILLHLIKKCAVIVVVVFIPQYEELQTLDHVYLVHLVKKMGMQEQPMLFRVLSVLQVNSRLQVHIFVRLVQLGHTKRQRVQLRAFHGK